VRYLDDSWQISDIRELEVLLAWNMSFDRLQDGDPT